MDTHAIVSLDDGKQDNLRASRRLRPGIDELGAVIMTEYEGVKGP